MIRCLIWCLLSGATLSPAQTLIDLRTQSKNVDFSLAQSTKPVKVGTVLPATCLVGELFFNLGAGSTLYGCVAVNSWSQISSSGAGGAANSGFGLYSDGSTINVDFSIVPGLGSANAFQNLNDFSAGQLRIQTGDGVPSSDQCGSAAHVGKVYSRSDVSSSPLYVCAQTATGVYAWLPGLGPSSSVALPLAGYLAGQGGPSSYVYDTTVTTWGGTTAGNAYAVFPATGTAYVVVGTYLPDSWAGSLKVGLRHTTTNGGAGAGGYLVSAACVSDTAPSGSLTFGTATAVSLDVTSGQWRALTASVDLTASSCAPGRYLYLKVQRDNTVASNYGAPVNMSEVVIVY